MGNSLKNSYKLCLYIIVCVLMIFCSLCNGQNVKDRDAFIEWNRNKKNDVGKEPSSEQPNGNKIEEPNNTKSDNLPSTNNSAETTKTSNNSNIKKDGISNNKGKNNISQDANNSTKKSNTGLKNHAQDINRRKTLEGDRNVTNNEQLPQLLETTSQKRLNDTIRILKLGYTIWSPKMSDSGEEAIFSIDPYKTDFCSGDKIRLQIEANTEGYLYVFHTENDENPRMLFPCSKIRNAENFVKENSLSEVPSSLDREIRRRWFEFYSNPATEKVYLILSKTPIEGVPNQEELMTKYKDHKWQLGADSALWLKLKSYCTNFSLVEKPFQSRQQNSKEKRAIEKDFDLSEDVPKPSAGVQAVEGNQPIIGTIIQLKHVGCNK